MDPSIATCEVWNPYKSFRQIIESVLHAGRLSKLDDLKNACDTLHLRFLSPLKNPVSGKVGQPASHRFSHVKDVMHHIVRIRLQPFQPRDASTKAELEKAKTQGITIPGSATPQVLGDNLVDEAFVLAEMFQMNEMVALDLLLLG